MPYARLFAPPGTLAFTLGNLLARLPMGMFTVSAVIMIAGARGSYALAGAVTATGLAATALVAPLTARLVDRHGQARIALPATLIALCGSLALVLCVSAGAPNWTLFASYALTATTPNTGGMSRARWAYLFRDDAAARHTADSLEQALDELCFMLGPVLAAALCTSLSPTAGTLTGCVLLLTGMLLFTSQRRTEPPPAGRQAAGGRAPLRLPGMPPLLLTFLATGAVFGSLEVVTLAYADAQGHKSVAGAVLACQAAGSAAAGLAFGALSPRGSVARRLVTCVAAMAALMTLPLLASASDSLLLLAGALLIAGMATAPTMVTGMTLVQHLTPRARLNEGMTLAVTAILGGIATGSALGGWAVERVGADGWAYTVPASAALLAALVTAATAATAATAGRAVSHRAERPTASAEPRETSGTSPMPGPDRTPDPEGSPAQATSGSPTSTTSP
ncbi:MFS transporter [Streptomyces sp. NPDC048172]|uniref:MFS transporter n=1 Tax=Streptomyces sp. NPDC048172 TaxID=3365505 RepID=UPI003719A0FE